MIKTIIPFSTNLPFIQEKLAMNFKLIFLLVSLLSICESSKILIVHTSMSRSHVIPLQEFAKVLAKSGHEITFVSSFPLEKTINNYRDIEVKISENDLKFFDDFTKIMGQDPNSVSFLELMSAISKILYGHGNYTLQSNEVHKLLNSGEQYDLVITGYFMSEYLLGFADHFKCPSIVFFSGGYLSSIHKMVGNPLSISGAPHTLLSAASEMNFIQRLKNFVINGLDLLVFRPIFNYKGRQIY